MSSQSHAAAKSLTLHRDRARIRELLIRERHQVQLLRAGLVGLVAGLLSVAFQLAVKQAEGFSHWMADALRPQGFWAWPLIALAGGVLGASAAWMTKRFAPSASGSGIPHVKAVLLSLREMRPWRLIPIKYAAGLLALTAGMSLGREGPTIQMGAAVGKLLGDLFRVPRRAYASLISAGAGAGLASAFNAPLAGFIFVMEELRRELSPLTYGTALIGSVSAVAVSRVLLGQAPSLSLPAGSVPPLRALPMMAILGIVAGFVGILYNKLLLGGVQFRAKLIWPSWLLGLSVGALAGVLLLAVPSITGSGYHTVDRLITENGATRASLLVVAGLLAAKLLFTVLCYSTGVPGGIFAPLLALGAMLGFGFAEALDGMALEFGASPLAFAVVGMAALLTAVVRAPLTGVVLIVEMTGEYPMLYSLLLACFAAYIVPEIFRDKPVYEALLALDLHGAQTTTESSAEPTLIDALIEPHSTLDGKPVKEIGLPSGCLLVSILREDHQIVPGGNTTLMAGDSISVLVEGHQTAFAHAIHEACRAP